MSRMVYKSKGDVTRDDSQRRFLAQQSVATLFDIVSNSYNTVPTLQRNMPWRKQICIAKCLYSYRDDLPKYLFKKSWLKSGKSPLPVDVRRWKTWLLKLPNMEGRKRSKRSHNSAPYLWCLSFSRQDAKVSQPMKCPRLGIRSLQCVSRGIFSVV